LQAGTLFNERVENMFAVTRAYELMLTDFATRRGVLE